MSGAALADRIRACEADLRALRLRAFDELVAALVTVAGARAFSAVEAWNHARLVAPELRHAFAAAGIRSVRSLGAVLRQLHGRDLGGFRLMKIGTDNSGGIWLFRECEPAPVSGARQDETPR